jgi:hypothetical protein
MDWKSRNCLCDPGKQISNNSNLCFNSFQSIPIHFILLQSLPRVYIWENTSPPPPGKYQPTFIWGYKIRKGEEKKGENVKEKARKGKENGRKGKIKGKGEVKGENKCEIGKN